MSNNTIDHLVGQLRCEIERALIPQSWIPSPHGPQTTLFAPLDLSKSILETKIRPLFKAISNDEDVERDAQAAMHDDTAVCRILAILVYIHCDRSTLERFRSRFMLPSSLVKRDSDLPLGKSVARSLFGDNLGDRFYTKQFIFCPIILKEDEEVECRDDQQWCRLPFEASAFLGSGSSGIVSKVTIPKGHFRFSGPRLGLNQQSQVFAWKEFQGKDPKKDYEKERENLKAIKDSSFTHLNILLAAGSLLRGNMYSLYFEAADCNLDEYLRSRKTEIPRDGHGVHAFLHRFRGLVDALKFLHTKLVSADTSENLKFAHLDLKPTNILIFMLPKEIWKIHDFGVSRVSKDRHHDEIKGWRHVLPMAAGTDSSSGTTILRSGSFLAPETHVERDGDMGKVKAASDVWSLGCVLSLVISFLDVGPESIIAFEEERKKGAGIISDHFFVRKRGRNNHVLNPGVEEWFKKLEKRFAVREPRVLLAIRGIIYMLMHKILLIKPADRKSSEIMERLFDDILSQLRAPPSLSRSETIAIERSMLDKVRRLRSTQDKAPKDEVKEYGLSLPPSTRRSKFSICGEYLAYLAPGAISFYETRRILKTASNRTPKMCGSSRAARIAQPSPGSIWVNFDISSTYLAAFTDRDYFDCYLYPHSSPKQDIPPSDPPRLKYFHRFKLEEERFKIHKMALSPDNQFLIHVLKGYDQKFYVYLSRVDVMLSWLAACERVDETFAAASTSSSSGTTPRSQSTNSRTFSRGSIQPLGPPVLPWKHLLLNKKAKEEISHVQSLLFSADSQLFTLASEPPNSNEYIFYAWKTEAGKYVNSIILERPGNMDTSQVWVTAFTPLMPKLGILAVTFQRVLCQRGFVADVASWVSAELNIQLLDVLPLSNSDARYLFIGRDKRRGGTVKALYLETQKLKNKMSKVEFQYTIDLDCEDWIPGRDSAATLDDGLLFLIARVAGTGFVRTFVRPNAPTISTL